MLGQYLEVLRDTDVAIPSMEMLALLAMLTLCLLFRRIRPGLIVAYIFVFRWGWLFFRLTLMGHNPVFVWFYCVFGVVVLVLSIYRMRYSADV